MGKALYEESLENETQLQIASMYDKQEDAWQNPYFPTEIFTGYGVKKLQFINGMVSAGIGCDTIIVSHINLLPVTWFIKNASPQTKIILLAHGIEIWYPLSAVKRKLLNKCDLILAVSRFTKNKIVEVHGVKKEKCEVLNNCLDPFLPLPSLNKKSENLFKKYSFEPTDKIIMTLTRLSSKERYKGYDKVIEAVALLKANFSGIKYLIAGFYDSEEKAFVDGLIEKLGLQDTVVMPGFIDDEELEDHFAMSDVYVMPSRKEGFGIVFIEAMYYGLPVIAGNIDGSADALLDSKIGQLVNPDSVTEIASAISNVFQNKSAFTPDRKLLLQNFSYEVYKEKLAQKTLQQGTYHLQPNT
ncbi:MAG: glycosyltransferase family 4 protein [Bacteroidota bacterium]|nr:glycosyltransferase family 4 protein [Bacteroidota bacterium]